jgi:tRNA A37 threonylcarbamoyladenosine dehydratase
MTHAFDYQLAFDRNIGWVTEPEQQVLRSKRVAIAGMGGVGGVHVVTLARLGVQRFNIADFDTFDIANFNRQVGATMSSLGRPKAEVLAEMVRDINPEADVRVFPAGVDRRQRRGFPARCRSLYRWAGLLRLSRPRDHLRRLCRRTAFRRSPSRRSAWALPC